MKQHQFEATHEDDWQRFEQMLAFKPVRGGIAGDANVRAILVQLFCHCRIPAM